MNRVDSFADPTTGHSLLYGRRATCLPKYPACSDSGVVQNRCHSEHPRYISEEEFDRRLDKALSEVARVVKRDGIVSIVFAHTDVRAWEKLLRALQSVGLVVTTSWPIRSEMKGRTVAHVNAALASSVLLVCRPTDGGVEGFYDDVVRELERQIPDRLDAFEAMGLSGADYFVSAIGPAFEIFARYSRVVRLSGDPVDVSDLMVLAREVVARHAIGRLLGGETLTALDEESLLYLTWRWAYLTVPIPADDAIKLGRAFSVDLAEVARPDGFVNISVTRRIVGLPVHSPPSSSRYSKRHHRLNYGRNRSRRVWRSD